MSAHFSDLDDEEFFVVEGSEWRSATPIRCMHWPFMDKHDRDIAPSAPQPPPPPPPPPPPKVQTGVAFCFSVVARKFAPLVGAIMNGAHAFATSGGTAWRRRQRRLRAFRRYVLWHSQMEVAAALHQTSGLRTSSTAAATQSVNFASAPVAVVGSLPPCEVVAAPVFDHVPVVREQVIVQAIPRVVGSHPPLAEFAGPVSDQVYLEQYSAGETIENIAIFPIVQEQVLVQAIPRLVGSRLLPTLRGGHYLSSRCGRLHEHNGTLWRISASSHRWCRSLIFLYRRRWTP